MEEKNFEIKTRIIKETFDDDRKIKCEIPPEDMHLPAHVHQGGDLFMTEDGEFIDLEFQMENFDEGELVKFIEFAEELYEKHRRRISIYILCTDNVKILVRECPIYSDAEFNIKLACSEDYFALSFLCHIKNKLRKGMKLDDDDEVILEKLPMLCRKEDRKFFRRETLKIINKHHY